MEARRFGETAKEKMDEVTHHAERAGEGGRESYMQGREGMGAGSRPGQQPGRPGTPGQTT